MDKQIPRSCRKGRHDFPRDSNSFALDATQGSGERQMSGHVHVVMCNDCGVMKYLTVAMHRDTRNNH